MRARDEGIRSGPEACGAFLDRLDRRDAGVWEDPHPDGCDSCREQALASRSLEPRGDFAGRTAPGGFAARVALLAFLEARDRRGRREARAERLARVALVCSLAIASSLFLAGALEQGRAIAGRFRGMSGGGMTIDLTAAILVLVLAVAGRYAARRVRPLR